MISSVRHIHQQYKIKYFIFVTYVHISAVWNDSRHLAFVSETMSQKIVAYYNQILLYKFFSYNLKCLNYFVFNCLAAIVFVGLKHLYFDSRNINKITINLSQITAAVITFYGNSQMSWKCIYRRLLHMSCAICPYLNFNGMC